MEFLLFTPDKLLEGSKIPHNKMGTVSEVHQERPR